MTRLAFYAPMKAPDDPVPSGDRAMARALLKALETGGISVALASRFRSREPRGDAQAQSRIIEDARQEIARLVVAGRHERWKGWVTYHNYYKAPDLLGPEVADKLGIPYFLVEATRARKRLDGPWDRFARAAETACDAAGTVFYLTHHDAEALAAYAPAGQKLVHLRPFLPYASLPTTSESPASLLSVGMMRRGDKFASYEIIAATLALLKTTDWRLTIAGDGPMREAAAALMAPYGARVRMIGALTAKEMQAAYHQAGLMFWPGVNEAFGMSYLEAQAAGVPVIAQDRPGVRDVLSPDLPRPAPEDGPAALAAQIDNLLSRPTVRRAAAQAARNFITQGHLLDSASTTLTKAIRTEVA